MKRIKMIGIDHRIATVAYRELFSFTVAGASEAMEKLKKRPGIEGCIILATCNRMELWLSVSEDLDTPLYDILCELKGIQSREYIKMFKEREGIEAVNHLFETACGLKSKIIGEDQIISQVKDALNLARSVFSTDKVLEMLFRTAVTAGKKVKTEVRLTSADRSAITGPVQALKDRGLDFSALTCMVIGNGEMGKLAATALMEEGADVTVTVRQYRNGQVQIPPGCSRINYGDRLEYLAKCDLVVSATASPNFTLKYEDVADRPRKEKLIMIDLAVPRDIEEKLSECEGIELYDIDSFGLEIENEQLRMNIEKAKEILQEFIQEFVTWYECRDLIPLVKQLCENAAEDVDLRLTKPLRHLDVEQEQKDELEKAIDQAAAKVVNKLIFGLRESVCVSTWRECVEGMAQIYGGEQA